MAKDEKETKLDKELSKLSVSGLRNHLDKVLSEIQRRRDNKPPDPTNSVQGLVENGYFAVALNLYLQQNPSVERDEAIRVLQKYKKLP